MRLRSYLNDYGWPGPACRGLGGTKDTLAVDLLPWPRQHLDVVYAGNLFLPQWNLGAPEVWGDGTSLPACQHVASRGLPKTLLS